MKPVFELKAIMDFVKVYSDRIVLEPKGVKSWGGTGTNEILFKEISNVQLKEANLLVNGYIHFELLDSESSEPMTLMRASNDKNSFVFRNGANQDAKKIYEYVEAQRTNPSDIEEDTIFRTPLPSKQEDFDEYKRLTENRDWQGIFEFNNSAIDDFGVKKELGILHSYLSEGEVVFALASGILSQTDTSNPMDFGANTWLVALTDKRVLFLDHAMLNSSVDTQSIRHDKIQAISASQGWVFGKLTVDIGNRSILVDNSNKKDVKIFATLANDWLEFRVNQSAPPQPLESDPIAELSRLADLKSAGILDDDEFAAAKAKILSKI